MDSFYSAWAETDQPWHFVNHAICVVLSMDGGITRYCGRSKGNSDILVAFSYSGPSIFLSEQVVRGNILGTIIVDFGSRLFEY